jgi:hypothetical protein
MTTAHPARRKNQRFIFAAVLIPLFLWPACRAGRPGIPGYLYMLVDSVIYEISSQGAIPVRSNVQTAAISPDGNLLLVAEEGRTSLVKLQTGEVQRLSDRPARQMGWNSDGSRFFFVSAPETNQLLIGDRLGNLKTVYRGPRAATAVPSEAEANPDVRNFVAGEISGCLFLDPQTFVFSAFEGVISPSRPDQDISANRAYLVDLATSDTELYATKFPPDERWRFVDVDPATGSTLAIIDKRATGQFQASITHPFKRWDELAFAIPVPGTIIQCANGDYSVAFEPKLGLICALTVVQDRKAIKAVFYQYDPDTQEVISGPDIGWGDNIIGPVIHPDGDLAAVLVYQWSKQWRLDLVDIESRTKTTVWTLPAPKNGPPNKNDAILTWFR